MSAVAIFQNSVAEVAAEPCLPTRRNSPNLNFEREDWVSFRTVEGLQQKAGVGRGLLQRLVLKELADNGLDAGSRVKIRRTPNSLSFVDNGPGIDGTPEDIAQLFSIRRPMVSSKLLRLPTRGALGNGLRVVAGAVLASEGTLNVTTRNRSITLRPEIDGTTTVVKVEVVEYPAGTRIEIRFGAALPDDDEVLLWADEACRLGDVGTTYDGKSSPCWYDAAQFHELLLASGALPVRALVAQLDGCSGAKAGAIVTKAGLDRMTCSSVGRAQSDRLLNVARTHAREVKPDRLGLVGDDAFPNHYHAVERYFATIGGSSPQADIPFVVEAWAAKMSEAASDVSLRVLVNRTPVTSNISAFRSTKTKTRIGLNGCGISGWIDDVPAKGAFDIRVNITTPYCPITSDGKAPDLTPFQVPIGLAVAKAIRKAQHAAPKNRKVSQKDAVLKNLDAAVEKASGGGVYAFNERQIYYVVRELVKEQTGEELKAQNFSKIVTDYESETGEIPGMYREPRGSLLHPHSNKGQVALGTLMVQDYERPHWTFNKILYIEKEGFTQALQAANWPERHDCAIMSSKGFTTRAVRDLVDKLAEHDEPVTVFCVHDADAFGTMIYQTFQEATRARGSRKIQIVNLGLEPEEALKNGLSVESGLSGDRHKAIADYVPEEWRDWLQTNRVELNAMTMPQFISWLDDKMIEHGDGKLIPPVDVLIEDLDHRIEQKIREAVKERILRDARFEEQVASAVEAITRPSGPELTSGIEHLFEEEQERSWRDHIEDVATDLIGGAL